MRINQFVMVAAAVADEFAKVAALYKVDEAIANKSDFPKIRQATLDIVNK